MAGTGRPRIVQNCALRRCTGLARPFDPSTFDKLRVVATSRGTSGVEGRGVLRWRDAEAPLEVLRHVALIGKAGGQRDVGRCTACSKTLACLSQTDLGEVRMRWHPEPATERADEVEGAQGSGRRQILDGEVLSGSIVHQLQGTGDAGARRRHRRGHGGHVRMCADQVRIRVQKMGLSRQASRRCLEHRVRHQHKSRQAHVRHRVAAHVRHDVVRADDGFREMLEYPRSQVDGTVAPPMTAIEYTALVRLAGIEDRDFACRRNVLYAAAEELTRPPLGHRDHELIVYVTLEPMRLEIRAQQLHVAKVGRRAEARAVEWIAAWHVTECLATRIGGYAQLRA